VAAGSGDRRSAVFYTPEVAADLREEPVLLFHHIVGENRSLMELARRQLHVSDGAAGSVLRAGGAREGRQRSAFQKVEWPDKPARRGTRSGVGAGDDIALQTGEPGVARGLGAGTLCWGRRPLHRRLKCRLLRLLPGRRPG